MSNQNWSRTMPEWVVRIIVKSDLISVYYNTFFFHHFRQHNRAESVHIHRHCQQRELILIRTTRQLTFQASNIAIRHQPLPLKMSCVLVPLMLALNVNYAVQLVRLLNASSALKIYFATHVMTCFIVTPRDIII